MKYILALLFLPFTMFAQQGYWQQQVDYIIEVELNDEDHVLEGFITMQYKNNSPNTLNHIYIHLWPNAYRNHESALADQLLENSDPSFRFSKLSQRGFIDKLSFKLNAEACVWKYDSNSIEIAKLELNEPLA
ncbi:MAG: M1 family peptidase, partial [Bacteroidetes bacterium]|nr:M1 family peptidase [Bacteroidota bacterium]